METDSRLATRDFLDGKEIVFVLLLGEGEAETAEWLRLLLSMPGLTLGGGGGGGDRLLLEEGGGGGGGFRFNPPGGGGGGRGGFLGGSGRFLGGPEGGGGGGGRTIVCVAVILFSRSMGYQIGFVCWIRRIESVLLLICDRVSVVTESFRMCFEVVELLWTEKRTRPRQEWCKPSKSLPVLAFGDYSILDVIVV
jgi:hypothetical protein